MTIGVERLRMAGHTTRVDLTRFLSGAILAGYGIFVLSLFLRHVMTWYINPSYVLPTTVAGAALIGFGALRLTRKGNGHGHDCCEADACDCDDSLPRLWTLGVLSVPLLLGLALPPRSLAAFSANQRGPQIAGLSLIHTTASIRRVSLSVDTRSFSMSDWVGALSADPNPKDYLHKPVSVTGMVLHSPGTAPPGTYMVMRYLVTCCIADARPVGLIVKEVAGSSPRDNQWVTITGAMGIARTGGQSIAAVEPRHISLIKPGDPYMY